MRARGTTRYDFRCAVALNAKFADDSTSLKFLCKVSRPPRYCRRVEIPAVVRASLENEINSDFVGNEQHSGNSDGSANAGSYLVYKHMLEMVPLSLEDRDVVSADLKRFVLCFRVDNYIFWLPRCELWDTNVSTRMLELFWKEY